MGSGTPALWPRAAILGLGLMGASLGMALRRAGLVASDGLAGYDPAPGVAQRARQRGAIELACASPADAVAEARLVVLAAPVLASRDLLAAIAPHLSRDAVITDLGSTKVAVAAWAHDCLPDPSRFVPSHPMTGRERSGMDAAAPDLYAGCAWCLTPDEQTEPAALAKVRATVEALGARPLLLSAQDHDAAVATISHLPLLAAAALTLAAGTSPGWPLASQLAAGGFRDTTRVASGDPSMARDICLTNTEPILAALDAYLAQLQRLRTSIAAGDPEIRRTFSAAKRTRDTWVDKQR
jgi:prephenate dehydrogenase